LKELDEIITHIFSNIFINRSKDVVDIIRSTCSYHLGEWISIDPERLNSFSSPFTNYRWIDEDYLKYIGWMSSDRSSVVRLEALESFLKVVAVTSWIKIV
jgi:cohesin complex subunit SA-1/2